ncbi:unnamed protein product [Linum tenue]|uniref:Uncharacterized protein n=1 Tax=Linum tenue TaxID=586396 RepID=A0AAV0LNT6_9ROSI|nr:unnamed protein product [Linum tenue]
MFHPALLVGYNSANMDSAEPRKKKRQRKGGGNVRCSSMKVIEIISCLSEEKRGWVGEMGFGELLHMKKFRHDQTLCEWLMRKHYVNG